MSGNQNLLLGSAGASGPSYTITANTTSLNEGTGVIFTVTAAGMTANQALYWQVVGIGSNVVANDFSSGSLTGTFTKTANTTGHDFLTLVTKADYLEAAEGAEEFYVRLRLTNSSGAVVSTSGTVTINDTANPQAAAGQVAYTTPGTYTFVAPQTTTYCILCVGGGGGGAVGDGPDGGGGGALSYINGYSLTAGQSYTVVVGGGGAGGDGANATTKGTSVNNIANSGIAGGNSYFINTTTCLAGGGAPGTTATNGRGAGGTGTVAGGASRATFAGGVGGYGTAADTWAFDSPIDPPSEYLPDGGGGGGAAGYAGVGGSGSSNTTTGNTSIGTAGSGGGGGGGCGQPDGAGAGGGGVGLQGQGDNGSFGPSDYIYWNLVAMQGGGGSGGSAGGRADGSWGGGGGNYGGGGGGGEYVPLFDDSFGNVTGGTGGSGAVRILWGSGRAYPSTNTADV